MNCRETACCGPARRLLQEHWQVLAFSRHIRCYPADQDPPQGDAARCRVLHSPSALHGRAQQAFRDREHPEPKGFALPDLATWHQGRSCAAPDVRASSAHRQAFRASAQGQNRPVRKRHWPVRTANCLFCRPRQVYRGAGFFYVRSLSDPPHATVPTWTN